VKIFYNWPEFDISATPGIRSHFLPTDTESFIGQFLDSRQMRNNKNAFSGEPASERIPAGINSQYKK